MGDFNNDALMRNQNAAVQARTKVQNRANVLQLKLIGQSHPTGLTANLLRLFEPRPPLEYKPPPEKRKCPPLTGMAQFVSKFAEPGDPEYAPPVQKAETPAEKRARIHKLRLEKGAAKAAEELEKYDPHNDPNVSGDPYKTLFVAKLSYETTESRIKREFESYGPIKRVRLVTDKETNKPRGYAFIEYLHTRDMKAAYKQADGRKIDGRRVLVDVERGRTVPNWRPRRLGGGLGTTRVGGEEVNQRHSGREQQSRSEEPRVREDRHGDRGRSRDRESDYDRVESKQERDRHGERDRDYEPEDDRGWYNQSERGHRHADPDHDSEQYDHYEHHGGRGQYDHGDDHYNQYPDHDRMDGDYHTGRATSESREKETNRDVDRDSRPSERSHSREYDY
ncbi:U1 small nuclear ribonucleoprotein of 70kDa N-terminal [Sesbania bispinosa]|nr:U1 small nuclear ribonucleoprotein of 70kDa N-terminal [Sesbania bispinosa]